MAGASAPNVGMPLCVSPQHLQRKLKLIVQGPNVPLIRSRVFAAIGLNGLLGVSKVARQVGSPSPLLVRGHDPCTASTTQVRFRFFETTASRKTLQRLRSSA